MRKYGDIYSKVSINQLQKQISFPRILAPVVKFYLWLFGYPDLASNMRYNLVFNLINPKKDEKILDVGSGNGIYSNQITHYSGAKVTGIEGRRSRVADSKAIARDLMLDSNFKVTNLENPNLNKSIYDKVICFEVLEHIKNDDKLFSQLAKSLKKNGLLIITVPMTPNKEITEFETYPKYEHVRDGYTINRLRELGRKSNIKIIKIEPYFFLFTKLSVKFQQFLFKHMHPIFNLGFYPLLLVISYLDRVIQVPNSARGLLAVYENP